MTTPTLKDELRHFEKLKTQQRQNLRALMDRIGDLESGMADIRRDLAAANISIHRPVEPPKPATR